MTKILSQDASQWRAKLGQPTGPLFRPAAAATYLGISTSSFYQNIKNGHLPPLVKIGPRAAGMPKPWLDKFLELSLSEQA